MTQTRSNSLLLSGTRVLDLTDEMGFLCGKIFGDLGADVIKIEKPGGDPARRIGPFYQNVRDPEKSLYWFAFNTSKRGITLDIEAPDGREIFKRLARNADVVVESFPLGYMESLELGYSSLSSINPRLVLTSITPFGETGPYAGYKASDLVLMAMGGFMYVVGNPERPPVRISFPQALLHAGGEAAVGSIMALYHARTSGEGQHVDVSGQESVIWSLLHGPLFWEVSGVNLHRAGVRRPGIGAGGAAPQCIWQCQDGYVTFQMYGGKTGAETNRGLISWMESEGMAPDFLREKNWETWDWGLTTQEEFDRMAVPIGKFFIRHSKKELYEESLKRRMMLTPVTDMHDLMEDPQLAARGFWTEVDYPELGTQIRHPGPFIISTEGACQIQRRAPLIGEHNDEVYLNELGLSKAKLDSLKGKGVV